MKKLVFFLVMTFVSQMFCENIMGQSEIKDQYALRATHSGNLVGAFQYKIFNNQYEAQLVSWGSDIPLSFGFGETVQTIGLQMKQGRNNDFTLYFPVSDAAYSRWNRIIAKNHLSFTAGDRGISKEETDLFLSTSGNVGIGNANPPEKLTVFGNVKIDNNAAKYVLQNSTKGMNFEISSSWIGEGTDTRSYLGLVTMTNHGLLLGVNGKSIMDVLPNDGKGYIIIYKDGFGTNPDAIKQTYRNKYALFVEGGILSEDFAIGPKNTWADHVFQSGYHLKNLNEVESYIKINNRLPDMPSAEEVQENGYTLHDMNVKLLQKVEELTLYSIEQNKEIEQLKKVVSSYETLMEKVNQLENKLNKE